MKRVLPAAGMAAAFALLLSCSFFAARLSTNLYASEAGPYVTEERLPLPPADATAGTHLFGAPYVTDVTSTSAIVNWVLKTGPVALGESPDQLASTHHGWRVERAPLTGLKAGTTYYYDVLRDGSTEGRGQFSTAPAGRANFVFVVYGDTRSRDDMHRQIIARVIKEDAAFAIHTGDLVADGNKAELWPNFFTITDPLMRRLVFFPMLGNHERNTPYFREFFPTAPSYYSFNWGSVHVAVLNSDVNNVSATAEGREAYWKEELDWLDRDLTRAASADFRLVGMHHPAVTAIKARQKGAEQIAARIVPLLEKHHVQAIFAGHDHNYQHHRMGGIDFIVTGGGGAPLYALDAPIPDVTVKFEKVENYVRARVSRAEFTLEGVALDGHIIETVNLAAYSKVPSASAPK